MYHVSSPSTYQPPHPSPPIGLSLPTGHPGGLGPPKCIISSGEISFCTDLCAGGLPPPFNGLINPSRFFCFGMALILLSHTALCHPAHLSSLMASFQLFKCCVISLGCTSRWAVVVQVGCCGPVLVEVKQQLH